MAQVLVNESSLEDIGDAIREKNASSDTYLPSEMGNAIRAIRTGGDVTSVNGKTGAVVLSASDVGAGTYSKPSGGIPKSDLASAVQTSLNKADAAGTYSKPSNGIPWEDLEYDVQTSLGKADTALQTVPEATSNQSGLMSSADKSKLDGIAAGAQVASVNNKTGAVVLSASDVGATVITTRTDSINKMIGAKETQYVSLVENDKKPIGVRIISGFPMSLDIVISAPYGNGNTWYIMIYNNSTNAYTLTGTLVSYWINS